ncbi:hypothetical protein [Flavihumibacter fluvii]|uniref:hypothetical protein n=1 Tax=Flavihumibacter fluvii TaxID=2838157 RepID=UPI001BDE309F|nr:hypothetical protein [Flavihumibacter fluvii]ULQ51709.1 hypothetical protein KJS93_16600 [Flavihumibacter fluvii]
MSDSTNESYSQLSKYIPTTATLIFTFGILYNFYFYKYFGINIFEFIDLSESLLLFIPRVTDPLIFIVLIVAFLISTAPFLWSLDTYLEMGWVRIIDNGIKHIRIAKTLSFLAKFFITYLVGNYMVFSFYPNQGIWLFGIFLPWVAIIIFIPLTLIIININGFSEKFNKTSLRLSFILITIVPTIIILVDNNIYAVLKLNKEVVITYNDNSVFKSDSTLSYIGKTKNCLFMFDSKSMKPTVINISDFKFFTVTPRRSAIWKIKKINDSNQD